MREPEGSLIFVVLFDGQLCRVGNGLYTVDIRNNAAVLIIVVTSRSIDRQSIGLRSGSVGGLPAFALVVLPLIR